MTEPIQAALDAGFTMAEIEATGIHTFVDALDRAGNGALERARYDRGGSQDEAVDRVNHLSDLLTAARAAYQREGDAA